MPDGKEEFKKIVEKIREKLDNNFYRNKINNAITIIQNIFETEINVTAVYKINNEEYKIVLEDYKKNDEIPLLQIDTMRLEELIEILNKEAGNNFRVCIDPLYLKEGINEINNLITTTLNDMLILVPKIKEKK